MLSYVTGDHRDVLADEGHEQQDRPVPFQRHPRFVQHHGLGPSRPDRALPQAGRGGQERRGVVRRARVRHPPAQGEWHGSQGNNLSSVRF